MYNMAALNQYQRVDVESRINHCNPHMLISMLFDGVLKKIALANGATQRGDVSSKGNAISAAINILDSLRSSIDHEKGGELSNNLEALYSYMERRLLEANKQSDPEILSEVSGLVQVIKSGWDAIPPVHWEN